MNEEKHGVSISVQAIRRMPQYLSYLKTIADEGCDYISAARAAEYFGMTEIQVRKDFAAMATVPGKPKSGFLVQDLIDGIETGLGFRNTKDAVLVGTGSLGNALLNYRGFEHFGLHIIAAFDSDPEKIGREVAGKRVLNVEKLTELCGRLRVHIGVITVPDGQAQIVCDQLVAGGVKALWNFTSIPLDVPEGVLVQNVDIAASLAVLSRDLEEMLRSRRRKPE